MNSKEASSVWLEASALFQTVLDETLTEWGSADEKEAAAMLSKVVNSDPELQALAQVDPDISMALGEQEADNGVYR